MDNAIGAFLAPLTAGNPWNPEPTAVLDAIDAAADAGYTHVGLSTVSVAALDRAGRDAAAELAARQLTVSCLEALFAWDATGAAAAAELAAMTMCADRLNAERVMAVTMSPLFDDRDQAIEGLGRAVQRLAEDGRDVVVEFLPWSAVPTLAEAWSIVEPLGETAGILLDTWHWYCQPGGPDLDTLRSIPGSRIGLVQLCDVATPRGGGDPSTLMVEALNQRLDPGRGVVDFLALLSALAACGASPPITSEVFNSTALAEYGPRRRAEQTLAACRAVLAAQPDDR